jgi:hypothetical protein
MSSRGIDPTVATYGTLISIASDAQDHERVATSWGWLQASGLPINITSVNAYLTALINLVRKGRGLGGWGWGWGWGWHWRGKGEWTEGEEEGKGTEGEEGWRMGDGEGRR